MKTPISELIAPPKSYMESLFEKIDAIKQKQKINYYSPYNRRIRLIKQWEALVYSRNVFSRLKATAQTFELKAKYIEKESNMYMKMIIVEKQLAINIS